jgi:RNA polymerase sigma factor (sigma-70 family)
VDDAVFTTLYEEHASRVYTYLLRMTASEADAADALQEAFTGLYARLAGGAELEHPRAYLFAAGRNAALRRLGDARRAGLVGDVPEQPATSPLGDGEVNVLTHDLCAEVRAAERQLSARQREVLALREVEELSYADIAPLMGVSENAAAQLAWRARAALRAGLRGSALRSVAAAGETCERARTLLELREDRALSAADEAWVDEHLAECERCTASRAAMLEIGTTYRAALPVVLAPLAAETALANAACAGGAAAGSSCAGAAGASCGGSAGGTSGLTSSFPVPVGAAVGVLVIVLALGGYLTGVTPGARGDDSPPPSDPVALQPGDPAKAVAAARGHAAKAASTRRADARHAAAKTTTVGNGTTRKGSAKRGAGAKRGAARRGTTARPSRGPEGGSIRRASSSGSGSARRPESAGGSSPAITPAVAPVPSTPADERKAKTPAVPATPATPAQPQGGGPAVPATPATPARPAAPAASCAPKGNNGQGQGDTTC